MSAELLATRRAQDATRATTAERVRWLVDNFHAYDALLDAIGAAQTSVWVTQLAFDADCVAYDAAAVAARPLVDAIVAASVERNVDVRILLNASLLLDTTAPLRAFLDRAGATQVQVRGVSCFPQLLHAKILLVDGREAFLIGSPFANGYWDDSHHAPVDSRRPARELGGRPLHDVSCAITGPAVAELAAHFTELWNDVSIGPGAHHRSAIARRARPTESTAAIRVARTAPARVLVSAPEGVTEILPAIVAGISEARSCVYIEHQYLSARPVIAALCAALQREPALEVIAVVNQNPDVTAYRGWQNARLRESGLLEHPRFGLFSLWSAERTAAVDARWELNQLFVHSKVLIADDVWAAVGSANLDGVSLHSYGDDFTGAAARRIFRHVRNLDVDLLLDDVDDALDGTVRALRTRLWREHLGAAAASLDVRPHDGWLAGWRSRAAENVRVLSSADGTLKRGSIVLLYSTRSTPRAQLAELGVDLRRVRLHFNPGWLEVHCSPNWVRNMFA